MHVDIEKECDAVSWTQKHSLIGAFRIGLSLGDSRKAMLCFIWLILAYAAFLVGGQVKNRQKIKEEKEERKWASQKRPD